MSKHDDARKKAFLARAEAIGREAHAISQPQALTVQRQPQLPASQPLLEEEGEASAFMFWPKQKVSLRKLGWKPYSVMLDPQVLEKFIATATALDIPIGVLTTLAMGLFTDEKTRPTEADKYFRMFRGV